MEVRLDSPSAIKNFISYIKCINKLSSSIIFQCTAEGLNIAAVASTMSAYAKLHFPPHAFARFSATDEECLGYGRQISGTEFVGFIGFSGSWKDLSSLSLTFTSTKIILTLLPTDVSAAQKVVSLNFEQVQFLSPRRPPLNSLACQLVSLPKPWLTAFDMLTALRPASSLQDIRLDVMPGKGVMVRSVGNACSRTLIEQAELYSMSLSHGQAGHEQQCLAFMLSFSDFSIAFQMAFQLQSMVNLYFDKRPSLSSDADPGPLILQVPSVSGIEAELVISALIIHDEEAEEDDGGVSVGETGSHDVLSGRHTKRSKTEAEQDDDMNVDHVSESDFSLLGAEDEQEIIQATQQTCTI